MLSACTILLTKTHVRAGEQNRDNQMRGQRSYHGTPKLLPRNAHRAGLIINLTVLCVKSSQTAKRLMVKACHINEFRQRAGRVIANAFRVIRTIGSSPAIGTDDPDL